MLALTADDFYPGPATQRARHWLLVPVLFIFSMLSFFFAPVANAYETVSFEATLPHSAEKVLLRGQLFKPQKGDGPYPAVILMHGCSGWQPAVRTTMLSYADYLVDNGFAVLNLDSFGPRNKGGGKVCSSYKNLRDARKYRTHDAYDAMRYLQAQDFIDASNIFLMGQSNGGSVAINVANVKRSKPSNRTDSNFRAVVAYYPWCGAFGDRKVSLSSPLLVLGGAKDDWVPPQECTKVRSSGEELRVKVYDDAAHSFDLNIMQQRYLGKLIGYEKNAAKDSREQMLSFFIKHLTGAVKQKHLASAYKSF